MTDTYKPKPDAAPTTAAPEKNLETTANSAPSGDASQTSWVCPLHGPLDGKSATAPRCPMCDTIGWPVPGISSAEAANPAKPLAHFTTHQALVYFDPDFFNEDACREWAISRLHPGGAFCPGCGLKLDDDKSFRAGKRCHCGRCGRWFTATTGTFLEGMHLDFAQVYALALLIELKHSPAVIAPMVGVSSDTVRLWIKKFRMLSHD